MGAPRELGELGTGNGLHGDVVVFDFLAGVEDHIYQGERALIWKE